jgi:glycosyltransferase involved in cell wall biosynthesis
MNFRQYYFAREFVRAGHRVLIASSSYSHQFHVQPRTEGRYTRQDIDGIEYVWIKTPSFRGSADKARVLHWLVFTLRLGGLLKVARAEPDVIIVSSPIPYPILPASRLARRLGARLVFEVRDIWPLSLVELGSYSERHPFIRFTQWVEDFAYRKADLVVSTMPKAYEHMKTRGLSAEKYLWIPNGMDPGDDSGDISGGDSAGVISSDISGDDSAGVISSDISSDIVGGDVAGGAASPAEKKDADAPAPPEAADGTFKVCYAGSFGANGIALPMVRAAAILAASNPKIRFVFIGKDSGGLHLLKEEAEALGAGNIEFREPVPRTEMPKVLAEMDLCVATTKYSPLYRFGLSLTKLADYTMAGKPVILSSNAQGDIVSSSGCGMVVPPENPQALAEAIAAMAAKDPAELKEMGERGRREFFASYTLPALAARYLEALDRVRG